MLLLLYLKLNINKYFIFSTYCVNAFETALRLRLFVCIYYNDHHYHHHHHHQVLKSEECRSSTTNDIVTSLLHFPLLSTTLWNLPNCGSVYSMIPASSVVRLAFFPLSLRLAKWFRSDLINAQVCISLQAPEELCAIHLPVGSLLLYCILATSKVISRRSYPDVERDFLLCNMSYLAVAPPFHGFHVFF